MARPKKEKEKKEKRYRHIIREITLTGGRSINLWHGQATSSCASFCINSSVSESFRKMESLRNKVAIITGCFGAFLPMFTNMTITDTICNWSQLPRLPACHRVLHFPPTVRTPPEPRGCVNRGVGLGSHPLSHSFPVPNKPQGFCGRTAWKKRCTPPPPIPRWRRRYVQIPDQKCNPPPPPPWVEEALCSNHACWALPPLHRRMYHTPYFNKTRTYFRYECVIHVEYGNLAAPDFKAMTVWDDGLI